VGKGVSSRRAHAGLTCVEKSKDGVGTLRFAHPTGASRRCGLHPSRCDRLRQFVGVCDRQRAPLAGADERGCRARTQRHLAGRVARRQRIEARGAGDDAIEIGLRQRSEGSLLAGLGGSHIRDDGHFPRRPAGAH
jgi:hypothetical protein